MPAPKNTAARLEYLALISSLTKPKQPARLPYATIFVWDDQTKALVPWTGKAKEPSATN